MEGLYDYLTADQIMVWKEYQENKYKGIKQKANGLLINFIESVKQNSECDEVALVLDNLIERKQIEMQYPLFKELILPAIIKQSEEQKPGSYKALVRYEQYFYQDYQLTLLLNKRLGIDKKYFDAEAILEKELEISPDDRQTAYLLANKIARGLDYAIHELPAGLLWDLEPFNKTVAKLLRILEHYHLLNDKWSERLSLLSAISKSWGAFLNQTEIRTYEDYLRKLNNDDGQRILDWPRALIYDSDIN